MKSIFVIFTLLIINTVFAQQYKLKYNGLNEILIGNNINEYKNQNIWLAGKNINSPKIRFGLEERYNYYFIKSDFIFIENVGVADNIFICTNKMGAIIRILIYIKKELLDRKFEDVVTSLFESKPLLASSGVDNFKLNIMMHWKLEKQRLFVSKLFNSRYTKIEMSKNLDEENFSDVSIE